MSLDKFIREADKLVEFESDLNNKQLPISSLHALSVHNKELTYTWERTRFMFDKYLQELENDEDGREDEDLETIKSKYRSAYVTYCRCTEKLGELADEISQQSSASKSLASTHSPLSDPSPSASKNSDPMPNSSSSGFHLPPFDIEIFNGDYVSWPTFRDIFQTAVINPGNLSKIQMLFLLIQKTRGEAKDIVKKAPLENNGFEIAWRSLCERFENQRILVNNQLRILFNLKPISIESAAALKNLQRDINSCLANIKLYDLDVSGWDPIIVFICSNRLPMSTLTLWEHSLSDKTIIPKWSDLNAFLTNRYLTLESVLEARGVTQSVTSNASSVTKNLNSQRGIKSYQAKMAKLKCPLCPQQTHIIRKCQKFENLSVAQRKAEIQKLGLCINCFSKTHGLKTCSSKHSCFKCGKRHNTLLHFENESVPPMPSTSNSNSTTFQTAPGPSNSYVQSCVANNITGVLLGTAVVTICTPNSKFNARALIDSGSEATFISENLCKNLKLSFSKTNVQVSGINCAVSAKSHKKCTFFLSSPNNHSVKLPVSALVIPQVAGNLPSYPIATSIVHNLPDLPLADPMFYKSSSIDVLIGGDLLPSIMQSGVQLNVCGSLMAQETIFGWILTGPLGHSFNAFSTRAAFCCKISLDKEISRFWEVENLPRKNYMSPSDKFCEDLFRKTTTRRPDGRYVVSLPFKEDFPRNLKLGSSRASALAQYIRNESRLIRNPALKCEYDRVLQEYVQLGHMLASSSDSSDSTQSYYLPHHAVVKPESTTTKVRVVFNASSASSNGLSLNDVLYAGPTLQADLTLLLLKWRFYKYVFNADIQKMYRQILVNPEHSKFQKILFRSNTNEQIRDFELKTVTFGVNCAPYLAIRTLLQLADDVRETYPLASEILRNSFYVDDVLSGAFSIPMAIQSKRELSAALESAGFSLRKWTSNSKDILADCPTDHLLHQDFLNFDENSTAKTLGIRWNARSDSFFFSTQPFSNHSKFTKREILSQIAKLFDPAGWLSPCIIIAKILMQTIWTEKTDWDEQVSHNTITQWKIFQTNYEFINKISIPRWVNFLPSATVQFHGFSDASEKAYAAALYIRIQQENSVHVHLITSKTKVAPLKTLSVPRLELCGALLLAELVDSTVGQLSLSNYSVHYWTDSTIVLAWLAKPPSTWSTFVANRVSKIVQNSNANQWHHVDSENNPADLASRGVFPSELINRSLWWNGPIWLKSAPEFWPKFASEQHSEAQLEKKSLKVHFTFFSNFDDILLRFSSYQKAMRVLAYVYRFFYRTHPRFRVNYFKSTVLISSSEICDVRDKLIVIYQKLSYPQEYRALSRKQIISASSSLKTLNPFLDPEGIIRCSGRLESSAGLTYNERHPIILPYSCELSRLIVKFVHAVSLHGGNQLVLRIIRTQFWIPKVKNLIKSTINQCKPCVIYKHKCQKQLMAALPKERTEISRAFARTGLDFAGPFEIKTYSGRSFRLTKGYVCVFVCFSTKAIHLELTSDLSTSAFLAAFHRFVSRRGCPLHLYSDNGTTFVGASKTLAKQFIQQSQEAIISNYAHQNIIWHFIPPGAPHMGGLWEAGVKSFKTHFRKMAGTFKYTFEEFCTLLSRIEACLNSRPLSPMSQDPTDLTALTPGHFLIGTPIITPIDSNLDDSRVSLINRWQRVKVIHNNFCIRWKNEYLRELQKRFKWHNSEENVKPDMLVVVKDDNLPPNYWRLGRILQVYVGSDQRVRVADIQTQRGFKMGNNKGSNNKTVRSRQDPNQRSNRKPKVRQSKQKESAYKTYSCRICRHQHALSKCRKFLAMNIVDRIRAVRRHQYCFNCLAHEHSDGYCLSNVGCHHCHKSHHTFLHVNQRLKKDLLPAKEKRTKEEGAKLSERKDPQKPAELAKRTDNRDRNSVSPLRKTNPTLSEFLRQNTRILLPTAVVLIKSPRLGWRPIRCLLDTASQYSRLANRVVEDLGLLTLTLESETLCPLQISSQHNPKFQINGMLKVENRIAISTPSESLPSSVASNYKNMLLADPKFYESSRIDAVIGVDLYTQIVDEGHFSNSGFPPAFSTSFGWVVFGKYNP